MREDYRVHLVQYYVKVVDQSKHVACKVLRTLYFIVFNRQVSDTRYVLRIKIEYRNKAIRPDSGPFAIGQRAAVTVLSVFIFCHACL